MSYNLNSLSGGYISDYLEDNQKDTRSLDYASYEVCRFVLPPPPWYQCLRSQLAPVVRSSNSMGKSTQWGSGLWGSYWTISILVLHFFFAVILFSVLYSRSLARTWTRSRMAVAMVSVSNVECCFMLIGRFW